MYVFIPDNLKFPHAITEGFANISQMFIIRIGAWEKGKMKEEKGGLWYLGSGLKIINPGIYCLIKGRIFDKLALTKVQM
jgi:hypothetical protein